MLTKKKYKRKRHKKTRRQNSRALSFLGTHRKRTNKKRVYKKQILKGGAGMLALLQQGATHPQGAAPLHHVAHVTPRPEWRPNRATLCRANNYPIYVSSLPLWRVESMRNTLQYYLLNKDIKTIISLQGCGVSNSNLHSCLNPLDQGGDFRPGLENIVFEQIKQHNQQLLNDNVLLIDQPIRDMTAGNINIWMGISNIPLERGILIHCLAGLGRSGSVFLFFLLHLTNGHFMNICIPYMGQNNTQGMINYLRQFLGPQHLRLETDPDHVTNQRISVMNTYYVAPPYTNSIEEEVFNIEDLYHLNLLISRINYITLFLAHKNGVQLNQIIYLYRLYNLSNPQNEIFEPAPAYYNPVICDQNFLEQNGFVDPA